MATWAKMKFFYKSMFTNPDGILTASSTEDSGDYSVNYIKNFLEVNSWQAESTGTPDPIYINFDNGLGNDATADYLVILGHNLKTAGATVKLQYSIDDFAADTNTVVTKVVEADTVLLEEFVAPAPARYWRLEISGHGATVPYMAICVWGQKTELDYATATFDPYAQRKKGNVNRSYGGKVTGIHTDYVDRKIDYQIFNAELTLYDEVLTWFESQWRPFFFAWDTANQPNDCWLVWTDPSLTSPFTRSCTARDISFSLLGRKE